MVIRVATVNNIQHGFTTNSLVDERFKRYPDFNKMIVTCRNNPKQRMKRKT